MEAEKSEDQVTLVTQPIGLSQKSLDLVVDAFHSAVVDPVCPPGEDAAFVAEKGLGQLSHLANARFVGPSASLVEERPHLAIGGLLPEQPQGLFKQIAGEQRFVVFESLVEAWQFLLFDVGATHQQQVTDSFRSEERRVGKECRSRWS